MAEYTGVWRERGGGGHREELWNRELKARERNSS